MKKGSMLRTAAVVLIITFLMTMIVGCGGTDNSKASEKSVSAKTEDSTKNEQSVKTEEKVTLTLLDLNPESKPGVEGTIKSFMEKYPNIVINLEVMDSRQYDQRIQALAAANDLPDIPTVQMFAQYKQMAREGFFMNLADTELIKNGKFDEVAQTALTVDDNFVYGVTWNNIAVGAFYNIDIFKKYNLDIPKDWDEFLKVCDTLKKNNVTPIVSPYGDGWTSMYPIFCCGVNKIYTKKPNYDNDLLAGKEMFNSPEWNETFGDIKHLYDEGYFGQNPMGGKYDQSLSDFANGKGAMIIMGNWAIPVFQQANPNLNFSMFPVPFNKKGEDLYALFESELGMAISSNSKHKDEAIKFFNFFFEKEPYEKYLFSKKGFSAVKGIVATFDPSVEYIIENYSATGKTFPYMSRNWPAGQDALMYKLFQEIMLGMKKISEGLDEMDKYLSENK